MKKPKFKMSISDMIDFNNECLQAELQCPQVSVINSTAVLESMIYRKEISAKNLVKRWMKSKVLFQLNYDQYLSDEAFEVFEAYRRYKIQKKYFKLMKEQNDSCS